MNRSEIRARILIVAGIITTIGVPLLLWARTPLIRAQMAEAGGWTPDVLRAEVGKPLHLKLTSDDVLHGFAVGQMNMDAVDIEPGKVTDVTLIFDQPGTYTFYCTRWCGLNHWRMRGTIEVIGPSSTAAERKIPQYVTLGLDIDTPHDATSVPTAVPSAVRGREMVEQLQIDLSKDDYQSQSPL